MTSDSPRSTGRAARRLATSQVSTRPAIGLRTTRSSALADRATWASLCKIGELLLELAFAGREAVELDGIGVADVAARFGGPSRFELAADRFHFAVHALQIQFERRVAELRERLADRNVGAVVDEHLLDESAARERTLLAARPVRAYRSLRP